MCSNRNFHIDRGRSCLQQHGIGILVLFVENFVTKLKVKILDELDDDLGHHLLSKSHTSAPSLADTERNERHWMSLIAFRSLKQLVGWVESLGQVLVWLLPLVWIVVKSPDIDIELGSLFEFNTVARFTRAIL